MNTWPGEEQQENIHRLLFNKPMNLFIIRCFLVVFLFLNSFVHFSCFPPRLAFLIVVDLFILFYWFHNASLFFFSSFLFFSFLVFGKYLLIGRNRLVEYVVNHSFAQHFIVDTFGRSRCRIFAPIIDENEQRRKENRFSWFSDKQQAIEERKTVRRRTFVPETIAQLMDSYHHIRPLVSQPISQKERRKGICWNWWSRKLKTRMKLGNQ